MNSSLITRFSVALALMLTISIATASSAFGAGGSAVKDRRAPDTRDAAAAAPDWFERHAAEAMSIADRRSPDTRDAGSVTGMGDLRSPDTLDAAAPAAPYVVAAVNNGSAGFDWTDASIGALGGSLIAFVLAGGLILTQRNNSRRRLAA